MYYRGGVETRDERVDHNDQSFDHLTHGGSGRDDTGNSSASKSLSRAQTSMSLLTIFGSKLRSP